MTKKTIYNPQVGRTMTEERIIQRSNNFKRVRIALIAPSNVGKSSFVNSLKSAVTGKRVNNAKVRITGGTGHTTLEVNNHPITDIVSLTDIWGVEFNSKNLNVVVDLLKKLLPGKIAFGERKDIYSISESDHSRVCHAVIFFLTYQECFTPQLLEKLKVIYDTARDMGRVVVFAISKMDLMPDPNVPDQNIQQFVGEVDPKKARRSLLNSVSFKTCSEKIQQVISSEAICYPLVNYQNHENDIEDKLDYLVGSVVTGILERMEDDAQLIDQKSEVFDPFTYETPIKTN